MSVLHRRRKNNINCFKEENGIYVTNLNDIHRHIFDCFQNIFTVSHSLLLFVRFSINHTYHCLIPKFPNANHLKNFLPIGLSNTIYKLITKIIVNRFKPFQIDLIGPFWSRSSNGIFSICSLYDLVALSITNPLDFVWIWKLRTLKKIKKFQCQCLHDRLPTNKYLHALTLLLLGFGLCPNSSESENHIFLDCIIATNSRKSWV